MKLSELKQRIDRIVEVSRYDEEVMIAIKLPYATVGAHPMTPVKSVSSGFDWEKGKFIIWPEEPLRPTDEEMQSKFDKISNTVNEYYRKNRELEKQVKGLKRALENKSST